jgi:hypothetical protein
LKEETPMQIVRKFLTSGLAALLLSCHAYAGTVTGVVQNAQGGPVANGVFTFGLTQAAVVSGTATVVASSVSCYTDASGNVVGEPNPLILPIVSANPGVGTLAAGTYFVKITYVDASGESFPSPEFSIVLAAQGSIIITAPVKQPASATGYKVYISSATGTETLQGTVSGTPGSWANFTQSAPLAAGSALPSSNTTACKIRFNDELQPSFVCYDVGLTSQTGVGVAGYPQFWYLSGGSGGSVNVGLGTPQSNVCQGSGVVYPQAIVTTPAGQGNQSINGGLSITGTLSGAILNCKNIETTIFCVDMANTQGWAGADPGAQINSAIAALPSTGGKILIASGVYNFTTPIVGAQDATIECPTGPSTTGGRATLKYTPPTGTAISWSNASLQMYGCNLTTSTSTTSIGILLTHVAQSSLDKVHINGFFGGLRTTGDGSSVFSVGVRITNTLIDGISALCTGGAGGYGVYFDHTIDLYYDKNEIYSSNNCATGTPMIIDTGASGIWLQGSTFEQGLNAGIIRNLNNAGAGGAYGGVPGAIFASGVSWDFSPGGDVLLFDSTLGTGDIKFFCSNCWVAGGGRTNLGAIVTATANGLNIQGGSNIHFVGGISRVNALWGVVLNTSGQNISIEEMNIHANNQNNTAGVGGIQVTANPIGWRITGNRSGNIIEGGGNQVWGLDISAALTSGVISGNDFRNNSSGRIKEPAGIGQAAVDAPDFGSPLGAEIIGPLHLPEGTAPSGASTEEVCYGDSTAHALLCSYNNGGFTPLVKALGSTSQKNETTATDANVLTFTPPATVGTYRVSVAISVSAATAGVISYTVSWTDSNGNAQSNIAGPLFQYGTAAPNTTFTTSAAGDYKGDMVIDVNNAAASIIVKWVGGGTTTAKMSATIERLQ